MSSNIDLEKSLILSARSYGNAEETQSIIAKESQSRLKSLLKVQTESSPSGKEDAAKTSLVSLRNFDYSITVTNKNEARKLSKDIADEIDSPFNTEADKERAIAASTDKLDAHRVAFLLED